MRFIGRCYANLNMLQEAEFYFKLAICECPNKREAYWELAKFLYQKEKWQDCAVAIYSMENIGTRDLSYISDPECWSGVPYDMLSICNYYLSNKDEAIKYVKKPSTCRPMIRGSKRISKFLKICDFILKIACCFDKMLLYKRGFYESFDCNNKPWKNFNL